MCRAVVAIEDKDAEAAAQELVWLHSFQARMSLEDEVERATQVSPERLQQIISVLQQFVTWSQSTGKSEHGSL